MQAAPDRVIERARVGVRDVVADENRPQRNRFAGVAFPPFTEVDDLREPGGLVREARLVDDQAGVGLTACDGIDNPIEAPFDRARFASQR